MSHAIWHIICGSAGATGEKQITVYDGAVSVAVKIDPEALQSLSVAAGMDASKAARRIERLVEMIERDWERWGEFLEEKLCVQYTRHEPHPANFDDH